MAIGEARTSSKPLHLRVQGLAALLRVVREELVAGDREQEGLEAGFPAIAVARLHAGHERLLDEVIDLGARLSDEETAYEGQVALHQLGTGLARPCGPRAKQSVLGIFFHDGVDPRPKDGAKCAAVRAGPATFFWAVRGRRVPLLSGVGAAPPRRDEAAMSR